jgi:hypothetical protein
MRILHFIDSLDYGGAETLLMSYIPLLNEHQHIVVTLTGPNVYKLSNYEYIELNIVPPWGALKAASALLRIISEKNIDIVHSHSFWTNIISRLGTPKKIRLINHYHFAEYDTMKQKRSVKARILIDKVTSRKRLTRVAVSEYVAKILNDTFPKAVVNVVPNFISCEPSAPRARTVDNNQLKVIAVGNCNVEKNYEFVLQAFLGLQDKPITLDIIGGGDQLDFYQNEVKRLGLQKVNFCGSVANAREKLINYDLFLSASISETFGIAILEGVCAKIPLMLSDIPAFNEIAPRQTIFFDPYDKDDLVTKLTAFSNNKKEYDYSDYGRVIEKYAAHTFLSKLEEVYND